MFVHYAQKSMDENDYFLYLNLRNFLKSVDIL